MKLDKLSYYGSIFSWCFLAASVCLSKFTTTAATICVAFFSFFHLFLHQEQKINWRLLLVAVSPMIVLILGMLYSEDLLFGWQSIHRKLPMLIFPILLAFGRRFTKNEYLAILVFLVFGAISSAFVGRFLWHGDDIVTDVRNYSPFINHIRLSIVLVFSLFFIIKESRNFSIVVKLVALIIVAFILWYLVTIESLTGLLLIPGVLILLGYRSLRKKENRSIGVVFLIFSIGLLSYLYFQIDQARAMVFQETKQEHLEDTTVNGSYYEHNLIDKGQENGHYVMRWVCNEELAQEWPKLSAIGLDDTVNGYPLRATLLRYMASKGLKKDSLGLTQLTKQDLISIEKGVANAAYIQMNPIQKRIHEAVWEFHNYELGGDPSGNSIMMRLTFWRNAIELMQDHLWIGVGTGDVEKEGGIKYNLPGKGQRIYRIHNQFLSLWLAVGLIGFLLIFCSYAYLLMTYTGPFRLIMIVGMALLVASSFWEDTLDSQAGSLLIVMFFYLPIFNFSKYFKGSLF